MKKSFENNIKYKLAGYRQQPDPGLKAGVLGQLIVSPPWYVDMFKYVGAILFFVSIYGIGSVSNSRLVNTEENNTPISVTQPSQVALSTLIDMSSRIKSENEIVSTQPQNDQPILSKQNNEEEEDASLGTFIIEEENESVDYQSFTISRRNPAFDQFEIKEIEMFAIEVEKATIPVVIRKEKKLHPYYNLGTYFLYNQVKPNLTDELYVGDYDSPFGLSVNRLGFLAEAGFERRLSNKWSLRGGLSLNNYNQQYAFTIRKAKPSNVMKSTVNEGFFEPSFDTEQIKVSKRVTLVGVKSQLLWNIFPEKTNVLFLSGEYQYLLGDGPRLSYDQKDYQLMKNQQLLMEVGLKKMVYAFRTTGLYLMPSLRYGLYKIDQESVLNVKPFSVGLTLSLGIK